MPITTPTAIVFDTETNRLEDPEPIQIAWLKVKFHEGKFACLEIDDTDAPHSSFCGNFKPEAPITPGSVAVHHILPCELTECEPATSAVSHIPQVDYIIGHNIDFDWNVIGKPDIRRICTRALAQSVYPEQETHSQNALIYALFGMHPEVRDWVRGAHNALVDVHNCFRLAKTLAAVIGCNSFEELWWASEAARIPKVMPFGKYKGTPISEVPKDYCDWLLRQSDVDEYLRQAIEKR